MKWIADNYQWIFGGIGATILGIIIDKLIKKSKDISIKQKQKSGGHSTNIQIGNINMGSNDE